MPTGAAPSEDERRGRLDGPEAADGARARPLRPERDGGAERTATGAGEREWEEGDDCDNDNCEESTNEEEPCPLGPGGGAGPGKAGRSAARRRCWIGTESPVGASRLRLEATRGYPSW